MLAFLLFGIDLFVPTHGVLTICGIIAFFLGSLLLSSSRNGDVLHVSRVVTFTVTALLGAYFLFIVSSVVRTRKRPVVTGMSVSSPGSGRAFRWTSASGMQDLGVLSGGNLSTGTGVNATGSVIVGVGTASTLIANSGIEPAINNVREQIKKHHGHGDDHDYSHRHNVIVAHDRRVK